MVTEDDNASRCDREAFDNNSKNRIHPTTATQWRRVSVRRPCPICDHPKFCMVTADGAVAGCMRIDRGAWKVISTSLGTMYLHRLRDDCPASLCVPSVRAESAPPLVASAAHRHRVYSGLLDRLPLSAKHAAYLRDAKGFSEEAVTRNLYATAPTRKLLDAVARALALSFDLSGVPGFYANGKAWHFVAAEGELLIPCRDPAERVAAILRRTGCTPKYLWASSSRRGGPSSGTPIHFALPFLAGLHGKAIITEGVLKADVIAERLHVACIGVPGATAFSEDIGERLRRSVPELARVSIAFDADFRTNEAVRSALVRLVRSTCAAGLDVRVWTWEPAFGKGLDDFLAGAVQQ